MALSQTEQTALSQFKDALHERFKDDLIDVTLYGSKARGDDRKDSDLDVLVVLAPDNWRLSDVVCSIATDILLDWEVDISPKVISRKIYLNLQKQESSFIRNVIRDGIPL
ncbi:MAG: nucleotidyltransferase domain-containing protein [Planctomycetes bacterium]|nr:nucleotidyltransferase domain-containing protein [Planctomycetota bacterium]